MNAGIAASQRGLIFTQAKKTTPIMPTPKAFTATKEASRDSGVSSI